MRGSLVAALAVLTTLLAGCADDARDSLPPAPPGEVPAPLDVAACPERGAAPTYADGVPPTGAVSLRICSGPVERDAAGVEMPGIVPPADALITGVDAVLATLAELPEADPGGFCDGDWRPPIHYVVGYADGTTRSVTTEYSGCHDLELGPDRLRQDPAAFLQAVGDALVAQRAGQTPPAAERSRAPGCRAGQPPQTPLPGGALDLSAATLCVLDDRSRVSAARLPVDLAHRIAQAYAGAGAGDGECVGREPVGWIQGVSSWGDPVRVGLHGDAYGVVRGPLCASVGYATNWGPAPAVADLDDAVVEALAALPLGPFRRQR